MDESETTENELLNHGDHMNRRSLSYNWTKEDRLMWVRWRRHIAVFYGCAALLIFWVHHTYEAVRPGTRSGKPLAGCAGQSGHRPVGESAMKTAALGQANSALPVTNCIYPLPARSLLYVLLIALGCEMQPGGSAIITARADESSDQLYPGRYVANCKPEPFVGCVCKTDSTGPTRQLFQAAGESDNHEGSLGDIEYLRMVEWLRATCSTVTRRSELR
jgi:hypothetical protein